MTDPSTPTPSGAPLSDQDKWLHSALGIDVAKHLARTDAAANGTPQAPAAGLGAAGSSQQSQEFRAAMQEQLTAIDANLAYTAGHAEEAKHQPMAAKRESVLGAYQNALAQIDPDDPAKAKGSIDQALSTARGVAGDIAQFRGTVEKAFNDWKGREPHYDEAGQQIDEMQAWGHPKAPDLMGLLDDVTKSLNARAYTDGSASFDQLLPELQPAYEDYLRQKAAQAQFEPARQDLDPRLAAAAMSEFHRLEPMQQPFGPATTEMDAAATAKDFVHALALECDLAAKVGDYEKALDELRQQKKACEDERAAQQPTLDEADQAPPHKKLDPMQQDLKTVESQIDPLVQAEDFVAALAATQDAGAKADAYNQAVKALEAQQKAFEDALAPVQPKLDEAGAPAKFKKLAAAQDENARLRADMEEAAQNEDFEPALAKCNELNGKLDAYLSQSKELEEQQKTYEQAREPLMPKLDDASASKFQKFADRQQQLADQRTQMEASAEAEDFPQASGQASDLSTAVDTYLQDVNDLEEKKAAYEKALESLQPKLDEAAQNTSVKLAPLRQELDTIKTQMEASAQGEDFEQASKQADDLDSKVDTFLAAAKDLEAQKKAYEDAVEPVKPKLNDCATSRFAKLASDQQEVTSLQQNMAQAEQAEDYAKALELANQLASDVDAYLAKVNDLEEAKKSYEQARDALKPKLDEIAGAAHPKLASMQQDIATQQAAMQAAEGEEDFDKALTTSKDIESKAADYDSAVADLEQKKKDFESARDAVKPQLDEINQSSSKALAPMQEAIVAAQKEIDDAAAREEYEQASTQVQSLVKMIEDYKKTDAAQIYVITYGGNEYRGTAEELAALKLKITAIAINQALPPLRHRAEANRGWYGDLEKLNNKGAYYVISAVVETMGGADLKTIPPALDKQEPAIASCEQAINSDTASAEQQYQAAAEAVSAASKSISDYLDALDAGAGRTITVLETVKVVCFAIGAAAGAAVLAPAGAGMLAIAGANAASGAGFAALESLAQDLGHNAIMDQKPISAGDIVTNAVVKGLISGAASAVGAVATQQVSNLVVGKLVAKFAATDSASQLILTHIVETGLASTVQTLIGKSPDLVRGQITFEQFCEAVFEAFAVGLVAGGVVGRVNRNEPMFKNLKPEEIDAAFAKLEQATTGRKPPDTPPGDPPQGPYTHDSQGVVWTEPQTMAEQMAMAQAKSGEGDTVMNGPFGDARYKDPGWVKKGFVIKNTADGNKIEIHYMYNETTGESDQFKFLSRGEYKKPPNPPPVSPGDRP